MWWWEKSLGPRVGLGAEVCLGSQTRSTEEGLAHSRYSNHWIRVSPGPPHGRGGGGPEGGKVSALQLGKGVRPLPDLSGELLGARVMQGAQVCKGLEEGVLSSSGTLPAWGGPSSPRPIGCLKRRGPPPTFSGRESSRQLPHGLGRDLRDCSLSSKTGLSSKWPIASRQRWPPPWSPTFLPGLRSTPCSCIRSEDGGTPLAPQRALNVHCALEVSKSPSAPKVYVSSSKSLDWQSHTSHPVGARVRSFWRRVSGIQAGLPTFWPSEAPKHRTMSSLSLCSSGNSELCSEVTSKAK